MTDAVPLPGRHCGDCLLWKRERCHLATLPHLSLRPMPGETTLAHQGDRPGIVGVLRAGYVRLVRFSAEGRRTGPGMAGRPGAAALHPATSPISCRACTS